MKEIADSHGVKVAQVEDAAKAAAVELTADEIKALESHYNTLVRYLNLKDQGRVLGKGCGTPEMTRRSIYLQAAYDLGKKLQN